MNIRFIAEVSSNHFQDLSRCKAFIEKAADIGCWGVKFQLFKLDELFAKEILEKSSLHRKRKAWELPVSFIPEIADHCKKNDIRFGCTPFYLGAVEELTNHVDFFKVASYELLWKELLSECARTRKPLMLSTGMANLDEVLTAVRTVVDSGCEDLTVFHCVSGYPTPVKECNLGAIKTLRDLMERENPNLQVRSGWSDHSVNPGVIHRAINYWQADFIEFHLDIDGKGVEFSTGHCWLPEKMARVIAEVNDGIRADGTGKKVPTSVEQADRLWRADPSDGLRPFIEIRKAFNG